ncbi:iron-containing redox enzyme family protein [Leptolyngbya sp. FACHB-261]|uniref:iron-containing redox enzyme family protein n=1 Tax=Leptolyngbya sp. FACHB-261 TaxID=2692806 RepID=UPI001687EFDF|nr:iron-containing redox enzyme family protein [Leptolyngbya sp. FACHB-261]MBD2101979.1 iron-containing redox enzyme family protein [Leptolyngbya sp. FACHB-261]
MQSNVIPRLDLEKLEAVTPAQNSSTGPVNLNYAEAEQIFIQLLDTENLDQNLATHHPEIEQFEQALVTAIQAAYAEATSPEDAQAEAHLFLQRVLYRINRLKLFWYDDLQHYTNERSFYLQQVRNQIEAAWQPWELTHLDVEALEKLDLEAVKQALTERAAADLDPPLSAESRFLREQMTELGYRHLLAITSFDGLVEASRLSRILGGAANEIQATLTRVLIEEYGGGRLHRKHSTFFAQMLAEFGMSTEPEAYFDLVPWQVLACANHNFLLTECKRHFLRYNGGLAYFEVAGPSAYRNYLAAAQRLNLSTAAMGYWDLHIREDERHGRWMMDDVSLPLAERYPVEAWQLVLGYDQEKLMGDRAGAAVVRYIREAEREMVDPISSSDTQ